jgi:hypothetical protein
VLVIGMPEISIPFNAEGLLFKAFVGEDGRSRYVVVKASDSGVDFQRDIIDPQVYQSVIRDAKEGKILLTSSHFTPFGFGVSVDAWTRAEDNGLVALYIMFRLKDNYGESDDLFNAINSGQGDRYQVSIGGKVLDYIYKSDPKQGLVRVITKAEVNHVAVTWKGMAVNPRTGFVQAIIKALYAWEEQMRKSGMILAKDEDEEREEEEKREKGKAPVVVLEDASPVEEERGKMGTKPTLKKAIELFDRLEAERRQLQFTPEDLEKQVERSNQYGISVSPLGFAVKPTIFAGIPDENFIDPVNYLFPVQSAEDIEVYLKLWEQKPMLMKSIYPDFASLRKVLGQICLKAKEFNVPISPHSSILWFVDTEIAKQVAGDEINEELHKHIVSALEMSENFEEWKITGAISWSLEKARDEQLERKLRERAKRYGYEPAPNAHLTKPAEYAHIPESQFADPVGYNYPIDKEHVLAAIRYFLKPKNRNVYEPQAQKKIYERILRAMKKFGHKHRFDPDNPLDWLMPQSLKRWMVGYEKYEDEDTPEKREEMERRLEREYKEHNKGRKQIRKSHIDLPYSNILYQILEHGFDALADLFRREELYKYYIAPSGNLVPPDEGYTADDYADPVSYLYPMTTAEEVQLSIEDFLANRKHYPPHAQVFIYRRLLQKAKEFGQPKEFDPENPLDLIIAAENNDLLAKSSVVLDEKAAEVEQQLEAEHLEFLKENSPDYAVQAVEIMKALTLRQNPEYLAKVLTVSGTLASGDRGIFSYWVIGQDAASRRAGVRVPPITFVFPVVKFPRRGKQYPVTDLSQPIAAVTKKAIEFIADKFQKLGAELKIKKSEDTVEFELVKGEEVLERFMLRPEGEDFVLLTHIEIPPKPVVLRKDCLAHLNLAEAIRSGCGEGGEGCSVVVIGTGYAGVVTDEGYFLVPYWITPEGEIRVEWDARIRAMETFVPEGRDNEEQLLAIIYNALREKASDDWRNFVEGLIDSEEGMVEEGMPAEEEEEQ